MNARRAAVFLVLVATIGGVIPRTLVDAAGEGWASMSPQMSGDWEVWQDADGTVREILTVVPSPDEPDPVEATEDLLEFFNIATSDGSLAGAGRGRSASERADALYNKLIEAQALSAAEDYAAVLRVLKEVYTRCDGQPKRNDFVAGEAREAFAAMVRARVALIEPLAFVARGDYLADDVEFVPLAQGVNNLPKGTYDGINQTNTWGWTCDADNYAQPLAVHFYMNGPAGGGGIFIGSTTANVTRTDVASVCGGHTNHGFNFTLPPAVKDSYPHWIYAYAISIGDGANPLLADSPKLFTQWQGIAALAVIGDSITRAFNANGDSVNASSCSWGDDLRYSWFSDTSELGQCYEHNVFSVTERTKCAGANPLVVANFAWNGADMYTDAYTQAVRAKNWLVSQGSNRLVAILLGGNDICTNNANVNEACPNDPSGRLDDTNHCRPKTPTFEKEVRRALDVLVTVPNTHIGVADPPRVSLLCRFKNKSVGSGLKCSNVWETATLFGASGVCRSLTKDCSAARIAKANEAFVNYRNAIGRVVSEYAAVAPGARIPANPTFGTGNVTKAAGVTLKGTQVLGKYLFQAADVSNCDCFHPYKTMQNKLAAWMFTGLQCSSSQPCVREVGDHYQDGAGINWDTSTYYSGLTASLRFTDVPTTYWAWPHIEAIAVAGITTGCAADRYCPDSLVKRSEMAAFLLRGIHGGSYKPPAPTGKLFSDVPSSYWAADWIEQLAAEGITLGCGGGRYCPDGTATRAEMAVFLLRSKYGRDYAPPPATGTRFADVPRSYWAASWIEKLAADGVTTGCGGGNYCPDNSVTRGEMAVFLARSFDLPLPTRP